MKTIKSLTREFSHPLHRGCGLKEINKKEKLAKSKVTLYTEGVD